MLNVWILIVTTCIGPGQSNGCATKRADAFAVRYECTQQASRLELMDEAGRVKAYCQRERRI